MLKTHTFLKPARMICSARTAWESATVAWESSATSGMVRASDQSVTRGGMDPLVRQVGYRLIGY